LIAKEVRGMAIDELARSITPSESLYVDWKGMLKERCLSRDIPVDLVMVNDAEATRREEAQAQKQQAQDQRMDSLLQAETRKALADAVKSLTQSDKNATAAELAIYNAIAKGLTDGISPQIVANTRSGSPIPAGVVRKPKGASGNSSARSSSS
jgi:hypothetical protein